MDSELLNKPYDRVTFLVSHRAYSAEDYGIFQSPVDVHMPITSQRLSVLRQLNAGARGLMFNMYSHDDLLLMYHQDRNYGYKVAREVLGEVKYFLDINPQEIVTLFVRGSAHASDLYKVLEETGLTLYLHTVPTSGWQTLKQMIESKKRLVIFSELSDNAKEETWHIPTRDSIAQTYSGIVKKPYTCEMSASVATQPMYMLHHYQWQKENHFGHIDSAKQVNSADILRDRAHSCRTKHKRRINFLALDFVEQGAALAVVDELNNLEPDPVEKPTPPVDTPKQDPKSNPPKPETPAPQPETATPPVQPTPPVVVPEPTPQPEETPEPEPMVFRIFPNPSSGFLRIQVTNPIDTDLQIYVLSGRIMHRQAVKKTESQITVDVRHFAAGMYIVQLGKKTKMLQVTSY